MPGMVPLTARELGVIAHGRMLIVAVGGALGRRRATGCLASCSAATSFPTGTLAVNLSGVSSSAFSAGWRRVRKACRLNARLFFVVGICGGFTTFSAFGFETLQLIGDGEIWQAGLNVGAQLLGGLTAVWAGMAIARVI